MAAAGRKGHLAIFDMKTLNLIKEIQVCTGPAKSNFVVDKRDVVSCAFSDIVLFYISKFPISMLFIRKFTYALI